MREPMSQYLVQGTVKAQGRRPRPRPVFLVTFAVVLQRPAADFVLQIILKPPDTRFFAAVHGGFPLDHSPGERKKHSHRGASYLGSNHEWYKVLPLCPGIISTRVSLGLPKH